MICRLQPEGRLSGAVVHGGLVYLAGQVPDDAALDAEGQIADVLRQTDTLLAEAGTSKAWLLSAQVFLADMDDLAAMNRAWNCWVDRVNLSARAMAGPVGRPGLAGGDHCGCRAAAAYAARVSQYPKRTSC